MPTSHFSSVLLLGLLAAGCSMETRTKANDPGNASDLPDELPIVVTPSSTPSPDPILPPTGKPVVQALLNGPAFIESGICSGPYRVSLQDWSGTPATLDNSLTLAATWTDGAATTLYSDVNCSSTTSGISFQAKNDGGQPWTEFYLKSSTLGQATLELEHPTLLKATLTVSTEPTCIGAKVGPLHSELNWRGLGGLTAIPRGALFDSRGSLHLYGTSLEKKSWIYRPVTIRATIDFILKGPLTADMFQTQDSTPLEAGFDAETLALAESSTGDLVSLGAGTDSKSIYSERAFARTQSLGVTPDLFSIWTAIEAGFPWNLGGNARQPSRFTGLAAHLSGMMALHGTGIGEDGNARYQIRLIYPKQDPIDFVSPSTLPLYSRPGRDAIAVATDGTIFTAASFLPLTSAKAQSILFQSPNKEETAFRVKPILVDFEFQAMALFAHPEGPLYVSGQATRGAEKHGIILRSVDQGDTWLPIYEDRTNDSAVTQLKLGPSRKVLALNQVQNGCTSKVSFILFDSTNPTQTGVVLEETISNFIPVAMDFNVKGGFVLLGERQFNAHRGFGVRRYACQ